MIYLLDCRNNSEIPYLMRKKINGIPFFILFIKQIIIKENIKEKFIFLIDDEIKNKIEFYIKKYFKKKLNYEIIEKEKDKFKYGKEFIEFDIKDIYINNKNNYYGNTYDKWMLIKSILNQKKIGIITKGNKIEGTGHVKRSLLLAEHFDQMPVFFIENDEELAINFLQKTKWNYKLYANNRNLKRLLNENRIKTVINDTLDSKKEYIEMLKKNNRKVITFEDLGEGSEYADAVINALYENSNSAGNEYYGKNYLCIDDNFIKEKKEISRKIKNVLITFGGTDSCNYTEKIFNYLKESGINIKIIAGIGYDREINHSQIYKDVNNMHDYIEWADVVITSNGRTVYEAIAGKTPTITICQNERECKHYFAEMKKIVLNCGLNINNFEKKWQLIKNYEIRKKMYEKMNKIDFSKNIERVIKIIQEA